MTVIWKWRPSVEEDLIQSLRGILEGGGVTALPTETFYALAAHSHREEALLRLFRLKGRPPHKPLLLLVAGPDMVRRVAESVPPLAQKLMERFWPGPLTLILPARPDLSWWITAGTGTVGVRQPKQEVTLRLIAGLGFPVTGTSANRSGEPALTQANEVARQFAEEVALIVDAGPCPGGLPSTVVDVTCRPPRLLRAGALEVATLREIIPDLDVAA